LGVAVTGNSSLSSLTNNATFDLIGGSNVALSGNLVNNGTVVINSNQSGASTLSFSSGAVTGTGTIALNNVSTNAVLAGSLSQSATNTISGVGEVTATITNNGTVDANYNNYTLYLLGNVANNNLLEATAGGTLNIQGVTVTQNASGDINAVNNTVDLLSDTITSGTLTSSGADGVIYDDSGTVTLSSVANNSTFDQVGGTSLSITGNLLDNGVITVNSNRGGAATMSFSGGTLSGTGTVVLNNSTTNAVLAGSLTQSAGHSIVGLGTISATLTNNGLVNANYPGYTLYLEGTSLINTSTLEATTGILEFNSGINVTNTGAVINANTSTVNLSGAIISGGTLTGSTGGLYFESGSVTDTLSNVTFNSTLDVQSGDSLAITGNLVNNGTITINSNQGGGTTMSFSGGILSGTGTIALNNSTTNAVLAGSLTQSAGHTITGFGTISAALTNNGIIDASVNGQTLSVSQPLAGTGTLVVGSGATLALTNGSGGSVQGALSIAPTGKLDITNGHMFINYGSGSDPIATIAGYIKSGYNNGTWTGPGIISSTAQSTTNGLKYGVGWADGADDIVTGLTSGEIEIKYTLLGDANLDGIVNGSDFSILAANFGLGHTNWDQGNFAYQSAVNGTDFSALAANFGQGDSGADAAVTLADIAALDAFAAANGLPIPTIGAVPEPATGGLVAMTALGVMARRRRK
jgi:hypothetical protein